MTQSLSVLHCKFSGFAGLSPLTALKATEVILLVHFTHKNITAYHAR